MQLFCGKVSELFGLTEEEIQKLMLDGLKQNNLNEEDFSSKEKDTWGISIRKFIECVKEANFGDVTIVLEYFIPASLFRLDVVLVGYNPQSKLNIMIVEMKEWGTISSSPDAHHVNIGTKDSPIRQHPAAQLNHYITSLKCYHSNIQRDSFIQLCAMSYLPNFENKDLLFNPPHDVYSNPYKQSCFCKNDEKKLISFLKQAFINQSVKKEDLELFTNGEYSMSTASLSGAFKALKGERFVALLNEQREVKMNAMNHINDALNNNKPLYMIIQGDAGTGKTIVGLDIIREYVKYFSNLYFSVIPRTLRAVIDGLNWENAEKNKLPKLARLLPLDGILSDNSPGRLIVIDEAHRLTNITKKINDLKDKFQIIIFLQDDKQRIKITEQGTVANISSVLGRQPVILKLKTQQRAAQSGTFMENLDSFLQAKHSPEVSLQEYDLKVFNNLNDMDNELKQKNEQGFSVKWLAPFCWKWNKKRNDITIDDGGEIFTKAWNPDYINYNQNNQYYNSHYEWYNQSYAHHIEEVGCIYTAQGLEFDYVGVIFWDDLSYDKSSKKWKFSLKDNYDYTFLKEIVEAFGGHFEKRMIYYENQMYSIDQFIEQVNATTVVEELIKNIYRVLLSRGKKGLYIWFKDNDTKEYFEQYFLK